MFPDYKKRVAKDEEMKQTVTLQPREGSKNCERERGGTAQGNGGVMPSAAVSGCLEIPALTLSAAAPFYTASSPHLG